MKILCTIIILCVIHLVSARQQNVIVVGGGIAGLAAARSLSNDEHYRYQVQVLEAKRDRFGGRVWTKRNLSSNRKDIEADLGASLINSKVKDNPLVEVAKRFEIELESLGPGQFYVSRTSKKHQGIDLSEAIRVAHDLVSSAVEKVKVSGKDIPFCDAVDHEILNRGLREDSLIVDIIKSIPSYSIPDYSSLLYSSDRADGGYDKFVRFGFTEILDRMVGGIDADAPLDINLRQMVRQIEVRKDENQIIVRSRDGSQISVDAVIIAVPLIMMKNDSILFEPRLPLDFYKTFSKLNIINSEKLVLEFDEVFWPEEMGTFHITPKTSKDEGLLLSWMNLHKIYNKPYLAATISHSNAETFYEMSDEAVIELALNRLSKLFGDQVVRNRNVTNILRSDWLNSLHIGSASVYPAVGNTADLWDVFSEPHCPGIYFAGEYTLLDGFGTAHGAYKSGVRAAEALMSGFCEKKAKEEAERTKREPEIREQTQNKTNKNESKLTKNSTKDEL